MGKDIVQDKEKIRRILSLYGEKFHELRQYWEAWKAGGDHDKNFFKLAIPPTRIFIEPTNICNKSCKYCARENMSRSYSMLDSPTFERIVEGLPQGTYISMTGNGEPMLNKHIFDMIAYAVQRGFIVGIITNGTRLTEPNIRRLLATGIHRVQISFDSADKDTFNDSYGNPGGIMSFEKTLERILSFIYIARTETERSPFITIAAVMTEKVQAVRDLNRAFWNSMPIDNLYEGPLLTLQSDSGTCADEDYTQIEDWKVCVNPFMSAKINADGKVNCCIQDFSSKYVVGDVHHNPLSSIVNSDEAIRLRQALFEKDLEFLIGIGYNCHLCNAWTEIAAHDIKGYLENSFPITYGLMVEEVWSIHTHSSEKIENLKSFLNDYGVERISDYLDKLK